jgi:hypothetical protein
MNTKTQSLLGGLLTAAFMTAVPVLYAQDATPTFKGEPDKSMAAAHEAFLKGEKDKAAKDIHKAARWIEKQSDKVGEGSKADMKSAGEELDKLGEGVKDGSVKSGDEMKKSFAKVDHEMAACWHKTAAESKQAGKDSTDDLRKAGNSLENSAKWSGQELSEGTRETVAAVRKASKATGEATKASAEQVDKWFKGIGEGIEDMGKKL